MGHRRSQKATETLSKVERALAGISPGEYRISYQAAKVLGLSEATLQRRIKGGKSRPEAREAQQLLSKPEKALEAPVESKNRYLHISPVITHFECIKEYVFTH